MTTQTNTARLRQVIITLMLAALSVSVNAAPCDPDDVRWNDALFYPEGSVVHHQGQWFESRELHQGLEPGITFDWKQLDATPDCADNVAPVAQPGANPAGNGPEAPDTTVGEVNGLCERPDQWLFSKEYQAGSEASHGGKIWRALRPNTGDMPGTKTPPYWELVKDHCALETQLP
ncbi:carbohydrate-binding protein [Marinobacter sp. VGCF2001]|uniref:carbohydrate-binding protein n=1 Tax=Marinobacter sp. VGCF2001 TaxID=3417189 RepID=UPI003CF5FF78